MIHHPIQNQEIDAARAVCVCNIENQYSIAHSSSCLFLWFCAQNIIMSIGGKKKLAPIIMPKKKQRLLILRTPTAKLAHYHMKKERSSSVFPPVRRTVRPSTNRFVSSSDDVRVKFSFILFYVYNIAVVR